jgi:hypothetical protein
MGDKSLKAKNRSRKQDQARKEQKKQAAAEKAVRPALEGVKVGKTQQV